MAPISITRIKHTCQVCDAEFYPKATNRTTCCSRACGFKWSSFKAAVKKNGGRVSHRVTVYLRRACAVCGDTFRGLSENQLYCSSLCRSRAADERRLSAARDEHKRSAFRCAECGVDHQPEYGDKSRKYCSRACSNKASNRVSRKKQRALRTLLRSASVDPNAVFDRDQWRCQICKRKTPRSLRGSYDDRAPELDHIMPLSLGGEHTYANTQCACRRCNAEKGATPYGQHQLFCEPA
jgi:5-methylcytosine-specific restriction endonuclease McrA